ncbi:TPR-like protein [Dentipellis sp. KUC8613]|nr:TPR-like protein [Dentipellis sp. KUC8613]
MPYASSYMSSTPSPGDTAATDVAQLLAARKQARAARAQERRERAELHRRQGTTNFENGRFREAITDFENAIITDGPNTAILSDMAEAYLAIEAREDAERCAQRALLHDPQSTTARYRRGLARKGLGNLKGAAIDFGLVLAQDPAFADSRTQLDEVIARREVEESVDDGGSSSDEEYPHLDDEKVVIESASDSSDYHHKGKQRRLKSIPCRQYNHEGCTWGHRCSYSHAPDHSSVRDNLGKNVCLYFLLDVCRFGAQRCEYSHCRTYLPAGRWWDNAEKTEIARGFLETPGVRENAEYVMYFFGMLDGRLFWKRGTTIDENWRGATERGRWRGVQAVSDSAGDGRIWVSKGRGRGLGGE